MQDSINGNCCEGVSVETPVLVHNRPGLNAVSYRAGNYHQFRESLLAKLSSARLAALRHLTTRSEADFTIALLDAWAIVADVLTFYQERIANESYLETATELRSVLELARLIGYELRPGVAASTYVAFTLEEASLAASQALVSGIPIGKVEPPVIHIEKGTKAQSIPGPEERPQIFETVEKIEARVEWNAIKPRMRQPQDQWLAPSRTDDFDQWILVIQGTTNLLKAGDVLLFVGKDESQKALKKIREVEIDLERKTTLLYFTAPENAIFLPYQSPDLSHLVNLDSDYEDISDFVEQLLSEVWSEENFSGLLQDKDWSTLEVQEALHRAHSKVSLEFQVYVFRQQAAAFGYNAPKIVDYNVQQPAAADKWKEWEFAGDENSIYLDTVYEEIRPGSYIAVQKPSHYSVKEANIYSVTGVNTRSHTNYGMSAKSTEVSIFPTEPWWGDYFYVPVDVIDGPVDQTSPPSIDTEDIKYPLWVIRGLSILIQSEALVLAQSPIVAPIAKGSTIIELSQLYPGLKKGRTIILSGEREGFPGIYASEVHTLKNVFIAKGYTVLELEKPLVHTFVRKTVTINANVAPATHGDSVNEVLGSGDAGKVFQKFQLKQPPLTFTSAATPSGTVSTLEVRVNDILWKEVASLYGKKSNDQVYITRQNDAGQTTVIFGDGITGARLPSGQQNIKASYRRGIGTEALLKAHQLSQLLTRPLGVKAVTNPLPASGAQDRERLADARRNANLTVLTIDRIVSLQDYEDFARAFAGISKAMAIWMHAKRKRYVHLTIAGYQGASVPLDSPLYKNLCKAIQNAGIPDVAIHIANAEYKRFNLTASIQVHPDYLPDKVRSTVDQQLRDHFSFSRRQFGQPVALSEVISVMQEVAGVVAVDVDALYIKGKEVKPNPSLTAAIPTSFQQSDSKSEPPGAELITIDTGPLDLKTVI